MKILLTADGRSPITHGWVQVLQREGWETTLISTFPCPPVDGVKRMEVIPAAFSSLAGSQVGGKTVDSPSRTKAYVGKFRNAFMTGRYWLGPLSLEKAREQFLEVVQQVKPDVVHALRIPFEGMLARVTPPEIPLLVSVWGNDLTLHANGSPLMGRETRLVLQRADGLLVDAYRDLRLAKEGGLRAGKPTLCVPGGGGIDLAALQAAILQENSLPVVLPADVPVVINPRGFRPGSVRNDTFFKAIPLILWEVPRAIFVCPGMAGQTEALAWIKQLRIENSVRLLPFLPQEDLWRLFKRAQVSVSISQHDGTPNSLLEAMALGCYPVVGDIESVREWVMDGENGAVVDPADEKSAAQKIVRALKDVNLINNAAEHNLMVIQARANRENLAGMIASYYQMVVDSFAKPQKAEK